MTRFRYWLADLISGGELTFHKNGWGRSIALCSATEKDFFEEQNRADGLSGLAARYANALEEIASEESADAITAVRRMARIAQEALK